MQNSSKSQNGVVGTLVITWMHRPLMLRLHDVSKVFNCCSGLHLHLLQELNLLKIILHARSICGDGTATAATGGGGWISGRILSINVH